MPSASNASFPVAATTPSGADCELPFYMDRSGLKRVRSECLQANKETSCDVPFMLDESGIRRVRPECASEEPVLGLPSNE